VAGDELLLIADKPLGVLRLAADIFIALIARGKSNQILRILDSKR
jgi:hypothetical protein